MGTTNFGSELSALLAGSTPTSSSTLSQILQVSYYSTSVSFIPVESPATRTIATTVVLTSTRPGTTVVAGQQTEFVPLTTFFTAPTDCNAPTAHSQSANATSIAVTTSCYPPSWPSYQQSSVGFYSPGVCPAAFEWADVSAAIIAPGEAAETRAICCPR